RHGAPGGCAVAELFLVFFELFYLFLVHYPMSVKQVRSGGKSECDVYSLIRTDSELEKLGLTPGEGVIDAPPECSNVWLERSGDALLGTTYPTGLGIVVLRRCCLRVNCDREFVGLQMPAGRRAWRRPDVPESKPA
ncbi:MAG TPA: hypothetical protein VMS08_01800, partial [Candidatus Saccharimonadia bacterium]|nr:hypothetical protein [Candidatus Saccharimonadia bacterium]